MGPLNSYDIPINEAGTFVVVCCKNIPLCACVRVCWKGIATIIFKRWLKYIKDA